MTEVCRRSDVLTVYDDGGEVFVLALRSGRAGGWLHRTSRVGGQTGHSKIDVGNVMATATTRKMRLKAYNFSQPILDLHGLGFCSSLPNTPSIIRLTTPRSGDDHRCAIGRVYPCAASMRTTLLRRVLLITGVTDVMVS